MPNGTVDTLLGIVPVVVTGGILLKFMEQIAPTKEQVYRPKRRKGRVRNVYGRAYTGDFSNVGY